ncbi:MAG: HNH endonuclease [Clostridiales bacterium]|nr:HNH endonuclease [Clostridiales bacterium]MBQ1570935.1 HNH endonuclease [Clostridiales bacterium]
MCKNKLNFEGSSVSDDYPSIDHIIPISKGGSHEWNNVQLLCRKCNYTKSNKIDQIFGNTRSA